MSIRRTEFVDEPIGVAPRLDACCEQSCEVIRGYGMTVWCDRVDDIDADWATARTGTGTGTWVAPTRASTVIRGSGDLLTSGWQPQDPAPGRGPVASARPGPLLDPTGQLWW